MARKLAAREGGRWHQRMMMKKNALLRIIKITGSVAVFVVIFMVAGKRFAEWRNEVNRQKCIDHLRVIDLDNKQQVPEARLSNTVSNKK